MDWAAIQKNAAEYFGDQRLVRGFGPPDVLKLSTDSKALYAGPIDWTWGADDKEIATKLDNVKAEYLFRCNQVEILMHESGALIERALGDVLKYDDLNVERFKIMIEFVEYMKVRSQQYIEQSDNDYWTGLAKQEDLSSQARAHAYDNSDKISSNFRLAAARYSEAATDAGAIPDDVSRQNASAGVYSTTAAELQYEAQVAANKSDSDSHAARKAYETKARVHQIERQAITQEIVGIKLNEMNRTGGALNYNDRMREVGERALNDFLEVSARLNAIALGLLEFYSVVDPSQAELDNDLRTARTRVEGALKWLRKAANAIARAKMDEQECIVRLTIQPKKHGTTLLQELKHGRIVPFSPNLVAKMKSAQLRGISATAEPASGDSWIDLEVTSPEQKLSTVAITLPSVTARLGRVSSSASLNVRDIAGGRPIINRNPVGNWTVQAVDDDRGTPINRLHLDFHLAFSSR